MHRRIEGQIGNATLAIETGRVGRQAGGAAWVTYGDTVVFAAATRGPRRREEWGFFPLTVEYEEKMYAAGKFPGGFFKREGRPTTKEILTMRLIDRPIRPLFPSGYRDEVQIVAVVLSADKENDPDMVAMVGASAALALSEIPFLGPIASVRVGRLNEKFVVNPTHSEREGSDLDLVVAGTKEAVTMVEAGVKGLAEETLLEAIYFGHEAVKKIVGMIEELVAQCGKEKVPFEPLPVLSAAEKIRARSRDEIRRLSATGGHQNRRQVLSAYHDRVIAEFATGEAGAPSPAEVKEVLENLEREIVRRAILEEGRRVDGRSPEELRPITMEVGILPRTHGSALFTRGETQAVVVVTLGTASDVQRVEGLLEEEIAKKFMLHYNFPPFCVGEVRPIRGPGRREIGHGALAEKALESVLPESEEFPYTIRIVSDIMESNGSSSMASVCGGTLCMMDAGIPIKNPVAGVAMGLVKEGEKFRILTDISGAEDHFGDMDFKVAGSQHGVTALQMDIKTSGVGRETLEEVLRQARTARIEILKMMLQTLERPRREISRYAPRLIQMKVRPDKIGLIIGSGGKTIRQIQEETSSEIDIEDDGTVTISSTRPDGAEAAKARIEALTEEPEVGKIYTGRVTSLKDFGAFVEIIPGTEGLCHISEFSDQFVSDIRDVVSVGDEIRVKVLAIDEQNRIRLSRKAAMREEGTAESTTVKGQGQSQEGNKRRSR